MISIPFLRKQSSTVALDIGSSLIKMIEIDHSGNAPKIVHFGCAHLLPEAIVEGEIMDRGLVIDGIRECVQQSGIATDRVVSAVSGRAVIVKKIVMDRMAAEDAQEAIFWEAEQHVPFDIDDVCLDFQILRDDVGANQMEVLLVAAKKDMVNMHASLIRDAGLEPVIVDVDSFAVQNCYEAAKARSDGRRGREDERGQEDPVVGLINIGSDVTNINIIQGDRPHFTRDISVGATQFIEALQKNMTVDYEEARRIISGQVGEHDQVKIREIVRRASGDLSLGIERSMSFLKAAGDADEIGEIVLSGGGAHIPFLKDILAEKHGIKISVHNPLDGIEWDDGVFGEYGDDLDGLAPLLTVGIGLALRKAGK
ncbi:MAG: type IV pilus assembly protein PilM [Candidatus Krumholzibacteria bacterium]|nr:type IV pilus assembly protein PilM [Candidatus Krumholzibacteria bacterium]